MPAYLIHFTREQMRGLKGLSRETGMPVSSHVRDAVDRLLLCSGSSDVGIVGSGGVPLASGSILLVRIQG